MMELHPVGVGGVLAVLGNAIRSETGAQVAALGLVLNLVSEGAVCLLCEAALVIQRNLLRYCSSVNQLQHALATLPLTCVM